MSSRYLTNAILVVLGGFMVVASMAFGVPVFMWLMFGAGIAALAFAAPMVMDSCGGSMTGGDSLSAVLEAELQPAGSGPVADRARVQAGTGARPISVTRDWTGCEGWL